MAFIAEAGRRIEITPASNITPERVWLCFHLGGMNEVQVMVLKSDFQEAVGRWLAEDTAARLDADGVARGLQAVAEWRTKPLSLVRKEESHA